MRSAAAVAALVSGDLELSVGYRTRKRERDFERCRFARALVLDQSHYLLADGRNRNTNRCKI